MTRYGSLDNGIFLPGKPQKKTSTSLSTVSTALSEYNEFYGDEDEPFIRREFEKRERIRIIRGLVIALSILIVLFIISIEQLVEEAEYFDYIIVGAGPAGIICAVNLARRLESEDSSSKVLLLESGEESQKSVLESLDKMDRLKKQNVQDISKEGMASFNVKASYNKYRIDSSQVFDVDINDFDVPLFWNKLSEKRNCTDHGSAYFYHHWPISNAIVGRAVGGSGIHNAMINVRALQSDFHRWNISKWDGAKMMSYYKALESYDIKETSSLSFWENFPTDRGEDGPLMTTPAGQSVDPVASDFIEASQASGIPLASLGFNDLNETKRIGAGFYEFNIRDGTRDSVASAFLSDNIPHNLEIRRGSTAQKVLFDPSTQKNAIGVQYVSSIDGMLKEVLLRPNSEEKRQSEIILSGGAIMTPQILATSGIREGGNIVDLSGVGKNLQDHPAVAISFPIKKLLLSEVSNYEDSNFKTYISFLAKERNPIEKGREEEKDEPEYSGLYGTAGFSAGAFLKSPWSLQTPDIQLTVFPKRVEPHFADSDKAPTEQDEMLVTVALLNADGRYELNFDSSEFKDDQKIPLIQRFIVPKIVPTGDAYLTERDVDRLVWGLEEVRRIQKANPLIENTKEELYPGAGIKGQQLRDFIKENAMTNAHWCGTTRMGNKDDDRAVVDQNLKVKGVNGLRVVDAGVMPFIPNGNTHSTTCAVAMHAVDLILER